MGRPKHCCNSCQLPEVVCEVDNGLFVWSVKNARVATLTTAFSTIYIVLDESGDAEGSRPLAETPTQSGYSFTLNASNTCGTVTCKKDCYDSYCCSITADLQGCYACDSVPTSTSYSNLQCRNDTIRINWRVVRWNSDWSNITVIFDDQPVSITPAPGANGEFVVEGFIDVSRCNLKDKYEIVLNGTNVCNLVLATTTSICCQPLYVSCIDKKNTLVQEINVSDYQWAQHIQAERWDVYGFKNILKTYKVTGLSNLSAAYYYPLYCADATFGSTLKQIVALGASDYYVGKIIIEQTIRSYDRSSPPNTLGVGLATDFTYEKTVHTGDLFMSGCGGIGMKNVLYEWSWSNQLGSDPVRSGSASGSCTPDNYNSPRCQYSLPPIVGCPTQNSFQGCVLGTNPLFSSLGCAIPVCGQEKISYINYSRPLSYIYTAENPANSYTSNDSAIITIGTVRGYYDCL